MFPHYPLIPNEGEYVIFKDTECEGTKYFYIIYSRRIEFNFALRATHGLQVRASNLPTRKALRPLNTTNHP